MLPPEDRARVRELLKMYLDERVLFYTTRDWAQLAKINSDTAKLQNELGRPSDRQRLSGPRPLLSPS